jgi:hypothetical protein
MSGSAEAHGGGSCRPTKEAVLRRVRQRIPRGSVGDVIAVPGVCPLALRVFTVPSPLRQRTLLAVRVGWIRVGVPPHAVVPAPGVARTPNNLSGGGGLLVDEGWQNQWGMTRWADFRARMTVRRVGPADLPALTARISPQFVERLAEFRRSLLPGDELYHYDSDPPEWDRGMGSEGYAILRDGELLDTLVVRMN